MEPKRKKERERKKKKRQWQEHEIRGGKQGGWERRVPGEKKNTAGQNPEETRMDERGEEKQKR